MIALFVSYNNNQILRKYILFNSFDLRKNRSYSVLKKLTQGSRYNLGVYTVANEKWEIQ